MSRSLEQPTASPACKICSCTSLEFLCSTENTHSDTRVLNNCRCRGCGLVFVANEFSDEELGIAYGSLDSTEYYIEIARENREKMRTAAANLLKFARPDARVIDIGTGNGEFLRVLHESGFMHVSGHEIPGADLSAVREIAEAIYEDFDYSSIPDESVDVVTMLDVVEHVRDPKYLLSQCRRILKPGGYVYFHTPVVTRTDRVMHRLAKLPATRWIGQMWQRGRTSVFHLQNYTRVALSKLVEDTGFDLVEIDVRNELSWPVSLYVRIYLTNKAGLPPGTSKLLSPVFYPFLATDLFNANKSIVTARKTGDDRGPLCGPTESHATPVIK